MNGLGLDPDASTQQPLGEREEYALDRSAVHRRTHTHTVTPRGFLQCVDCSRKLEDPEKPTSGRTCKLDVDARPGTLKGLISFAPPQWL